MACHDQAMRKLHIKYPTSGSHFFMAKESDKEEFNRIVFANPPSSCHKPLAQGIHMLRT